MRACCRSRAPAENEFFRTVSILPMANTPARKLCVFCEDVRDDKKRNPVHVIHPVNGMQMLFDERGEAVCPICQATLIDLTNQTFSAIKTGSVGLNGATATVLSTILVELRNLTNQSRPEISRVLATMTLPRH